MLSQLFNLEFATDKAYSFTRRKPAIIAISCLGSVIIIALLIWFFAFASPAIKYDEATRLVGTDSAKALSIVNTLSDDYRDTALLKKYINAVKLKDYSLFEQSISEFSALGDYKDSNAILSEAKYSYAGQLANEGEFDKAYDMYMDSQYSDFETCAKDTLYTAATMASDNNTAAMYMSRISGYRDADEKYKLYKYSYANELIENGEKANAAQVLSELNAVSVYSDSLTLEHKLWYELALNAAANNDYVTAEKYIASAKDYPSAEIVADLALEYKNTHAYNTAVELMANEDYVEAIAIFDTIVGFKDADTLNEQCEKIAYKWEFDGFLSTDGTEATKTTEFYSDDKIYIVGTLTGGKPEKTVDLVFTWTDCKKRKSTCVVKDWTDNTNGGCYFSYSHPKNADTGKSTITVTIKGEEEAIATFNFKVTVK